MGFLRSQSPIPVSGFRDHERQAQWVLQILIAKTSGFRDHDRQTQWVLEILIAKPSGWVP